MIHALRSSSARPCVPPERANEGHVALRLGDPSGVWSVLLNGHEVGHVVDEALAGDPGVVHIIRRVVGGMSYATDRWVAGTVRVRREDW